MHGKHSIKNNKNRFEKIATSKYLIASHLNIHKYSWTSPGRKTQNQTNHMLIYRRLYSTLLDV